MSVIAFEPEAALDGVMQFLCACNRDTRAQIAFRTGVSSIQLSDVIQGHVNPSEELAVRLLEVVSDSFSFEEV